jgi:hypothetical protein
MAAVISSRPKTEEGRKILDKLEARHKLQPERVMEDTTRQYHLEAADAGIDALDPWLDKIDRGWRRQVNNWTPRD